MPPRPRLLLLFGLLPVAIGGWPDSAATRLPPAPRPLVKTTDSLRYARVPGPHGGRRALRLDLYAPSWATRGARLPAVVWVHGGGFCHGTRRDAKTVELARAFALDGYVAASIDYRLLARNCHEDPLRDFPRGRMRAARAAAHDAERAVAWLRRHARRYGIAPGRIGIGGTSAGAVTALLVGLDGRRPGGRPAVGGAVSISGALPRARRARRGDPPVLFLHGTEDPIVPYRWARADAAALHRAQVHVRLKALHGAGHVPWARYGQQFIAASETFFDRVLRHPRGRTAGRHRAG